MSATLFTIGHSTRPIDELGDMLQAAGIEQLWDVRRHPGSRKNPQFGKDALAGSLAALGIAYEHAPGLGGRRTARADSPNGAWRNDSFRGYADHTATSEFSSAFERLLIEAARAPTAVLCAEALPHRCHRRLIADYATLRGLPVVHLLSTRRSEPHRLHPDARLTDDGRLIYPAPEQAQLVLGE